MYTVWIAHRDAEKCPLGALAIFFHYIWDYRRIEDELGINWGKNKSWRKVRTQAFTCLIDPDLFDQVRVLFGKQPDAPMSEQGLYKLYVRAFKKAEFKSKIKQHLPRHLMPYRQHELGWV